MSGVRTIERFLERRVTVASTPELSIGAKSGTGNRTELRGENESQIAALDVGGRLTPTRGVLLHGPPGCSRARPRLFRREKTHTKREREGRGIIVRGGSSLAESKSRSLSLSLSLSTLSRRSLASKSLPILISPTTISRERVGKCESRRRCVFFRSLSQERDVSRDSTISRAHPLRFHARRHGVLRALSGRRSSPRRRRARASAPSSRSRAPTCTRRTWARPRPSSGAAPARAIFLRAEKNGKGHATHAPAALRSAFLVRRAFSERRRERESLVGGVLACFRESSSESSCERERERKRVRRFGERTDICITR